MPRRPEAIALTDPFGGNLRAEAQLLELDAKLLRHAKNLRDAKRARLGHVFCLWLFLFDRMNIKL